METTFTQFDTDGKCEQANLLRAGDPTPFGPVTEATLTGVFVSAEGGERFVPFGKLQRSALVVPLVVLS